MAVRPAGAAASSDAVAELVAALTSYVPIKADPSRAAATRTLDYVPAGSLRPVRAALSAASSSACTIAVIGDSMVAGNTSSAYALRWVNRLAVHLRTRLGLSAGGIGYVEYFNDYFTGGGTWPYAATGGSNNTGYGLTSKCQQVSSGTSNGFDLTVPAGTSGVDIIGVQYASSWQFTWAVDSGSTTTVTVGSGSTANGKALAQIRNLSTGSGHVINVRYASGVAFFEGAMVYAGDESSGVRVIAGGRSGWTTSDWSSALATSTHLGIFTTYQPQVVVLETLVNDYTNGTVQVQTAAQAKTNILAQIAAIRALYTAPSYSPAPTAYGPAFVLCPPWIRFNNSGGALADTWDEYVTACYEIAAADSMGLVSVFDLGGRVNPTSEPNNGRVYGILTTDAIHPADAGHDYWARELANWLVDSSKG